MSTTPEQTQSTTKTRIRQILDVALNFAKLAEIVLRWVLDH